MRKFLIPFLLIFASWQISAQSFRLPVTKYDWTELARSIVGESTDKYEQSYKIYRWLCDNITYDTGHTIYTADECFEQKKGVCQAYSELFYRLANAVGLESEVILGLSKGMDGTIDKIGHAWVQAYMEDYSTILIDPTWGAGGMMNGGFVHTEGDDTWFDIDPEWLIFTHFPKEEEYQHLDEDIDSLAFAGLPYMLPGYKDFGQDGEELLKSCLEGNVPQLPVYYPQHLPLVEVGKIPVERELRVGQYYDFTLKRKGDVELFLKNGNYSMEEWTLMQDGFQSASYMPAVPGDLHLGVRFPDGDMEAFVTYKVAEPTADELAALEQAEPQRSPLLTSLENYDAVYWKERGLEAGEILEAVRRDSITALPKLYSQLGYDIVEIPLNLTLKAKETYKFSIKPLEGVKWALINGSNLWFTEWTQDESGVLSMEVTPKFKGTLLLMVQTEENGPFNYCIEYDVVK